MNPDFICIINKADPGFDFSNIGVIEPEVRVRNGIYIKPGIEKFLVKNESGYTLILGDLISKQNTNDITSGNSFNLKGIFYGIRYNSKDNSIAFFSSLFSLLPMFTYNTNEFLYISSSIELIRRSADSFKCNINKRFILELTLFNYSFSNQTIFEGVLLVPVNHKVVWRNGSVAMEKIFEISTLFPAVNEVLDISLDDLSTSFNANVPEYFPRDKCIVNFTSGFDGRTLVAIGLASGKKFDTFSFGTIQNSDVSVPVKISKKLNINHRWYNLGDDLYTSKGFYEYGKKMIEEHGLQSNLIYTHFYRTAEIIAQESSILLTGYMGSELLRALHVAGAMSSAELYSFFNEDDKDAWIPKIRNSQKLQILDQAIFHDSMELLISDLISYKERSSGLTKNQVFYRYVFDEIFRKFFGSLIKVQSDYLTIRAPFIDFDFLKLILKSKYAGVNNDFYTHNPLKRYKGQVLYSWIINQNSRQMARMKTGKGYSPSNIISPLGKVPIAINYSKNKLIKKISKPDLDNLGLISGFRSIHSNRKDEPLSNLYNKNTYQHLAKNIARIPEFQRDSLLQAVSVSFFEKFLD